MTGERRASSRFAPTQATALSSPPLAGTLSSQRPELVEQARALLGEELGDVRLETDPTLSTQGKRGVAEPGRIAVAPGHEHDSAVLAEELVHVAQHRFRGAAAGRTELESEAAEGTRALLAGERFDVQLASQGQPLFSSGRTSKDALEIDERYLTRREEIEASLQARLEEHVAELARPELSSEERADLEARKLEVTRELTAYQSLIQKHDEEHTAHLAELKTNEETTTKTKKKTKKKTEEKPTENNGPSVEYRRLEFRSRQLDELEIFDAGLRGEWAYRHDRKLARAFEGVFDADYRDELQATGVAFETKDIELCKEILRVERELYVQDMQAHLLTGIKAKGDTRIAVAEVLRKISARVEERMDDLNDAFQVWVEQPVGTPASQSPSTAPQNEPTTDKDKKKTKKNAKTTSRLDQLKAKKLTTELFPAVSHTRNFDAQIRLFLRNKYFGKYYRNNSKEVRLQKSMEFSALPGISRHHWATDVDFISTEANWNEEPLASVHQWLIANAPAFGFVQPYTNDSTRRGHKAEEWHWTYLPISLLLRQLHHSDFDNILDMVAEAILNHVKDSSGSKPPPGVTKEEYKRRLKEFQDDWTKDSLVAALKSMGIESYLNGVHESATQP